MEQSKTVKLVAVVYRKPGTTLEQFIDHYDNRHVPLVAGFMGDDLLHYIRNYPAGGNPFGLGEAATFDCITEFHFKDQAAMERAIGRCQAPENAPLIRADEKRFMDIDRAQMIVADVHEWTTAAN